MYLLVLHFISYRKCHGNIIYFPLTMDDAQFFVIRLLHNKYKYKYVFKFLAHAGAQVDD